jgi:peptide/nickel transport system ATP-binding protein
MSRYLLQVSNLKKYYPVKTSILSALFQKNDGRVVKALDGVSFEVEHGDSIAIVGESGCGKSTTAKTILRLIEPSSGEVIFNGKNIFELKAKELRELRKELQVVYQDPYEALNPKQRIIDILREPLIANAIGTYAQQMVRVKEVLEEVGLTPVENYLYRFPHELSGGQRQRVAIATALTVKPKCMIADEPVSMLDISKRMDIIHLLNKLKHDHQLTLIIITHDLPIARYLANKTIVMYLGKIVEFGTTEQILHSPAHPYTRALVSVARSSEQFQSDSKMLLQGETPNPLRVPSGCRFHTRCPFAQEICKRVEPELTVSSTRQKVACHFTEELFQNSSDRSLEMQKRMV